MGQPQLDEITIRIQYTPQGEFEAFKYMDQEGCGHESGWMYPGLPIDSLIQYHLNHLSVSHKLELKKMCGFTIEASMGKKGCSLTCTLEAHEENVRHQFEL